jgi:hypothetical protein
MKAYAGVHVQIHVFLTSTLDGGEWSASRPAALTPEKEPPPFPLYRRLDGLQSQSGQYGEVKILDPTGTQTLIPLVSSL